VVFIGRMTSLKGVDLLIDAIGLLSRRGDKPEFHLAGDGPVRTVAEERVRRMGTIATFHGWLTQGRTTTLLREGGVLALPSTWPEPFGLVGLEAAAQGIPAVAFDVGGIQEWLVPGVNGEIASGEPPTADGFSSALARTLDPARWASLSAGAFSAAARFAPSVHIEAIEETLRTAAQAG
jgi:glycosyltransferase involved in cell wall biosynthesis